MMHGQKNIIILPLLKLVVKKLLELSYILKKKYVCIPRSFIVINVCNQGKNLCSPCILVSLGSKKVNKSLYRSGLALIVLGV
jgi:hypothetical protein